MAYLHSLWPSQCSEPGTKTLYCNVTFNGASNPSASEGKCLAATPTRTGQGLYSMTLRGDGPLDIISFQATSMIASDTPANLRHVMIKAIDETNRVITFKATDFATPTLQDIAAADKVFFTIVVKDVSL